MAQYGNNCASGRSRNHYGNSYTYTSNYTYNNGPREPGASEPQPLPIPQTDLNNKLFEAVETMQLHRITYLLDKGADPNSCKSSNNGGQHALCVAVGNGHLGIDEILLKAGANVDNHDGQERTALHAAARRGNDKIITKLFLAGADVNARDRSGETPLMMASSRKHATTIKLLLDAGAKFNGGSDLCEHKLLILCSLTSTGQCCACYDKRPKAAMYPEYVDGVGSVLQGRRWQHYCCFCKQWWEEKVAASTEGLPRSRALAIFHRLLA